MATAALGCGVSALLPSVSKSGVCFLSVRSPQSLKLCQWDGRHAPSAAFTNQCSQVSLGTNHCSPLMRHKKPSVFPLFSSESPTRVMTSAVAVAEASISPADVPSLLQWLEAAGFPPTSSTFSMEPSEACLKGVKLTAARALRSREPILSIPENFSVTALDVANHPVLSAVATPETSDLALLALWLLWETNQGEASPWAPYVRTFLTPSLSPLLWSEEERTSLLKGHSSLSDINERVLEIESFFENFKSALFSHNASQFPEASFSSQGFKESFVKVLSRAIFLPEVGIFALVPVADFIRHSPLSKSTFQYDTENQAVVLSSGLAVQPGEEIFASLAPELSNFDMALRFGEVAESNPNDVIYFPASLVGADPLFMVKKQLLQEEGFTESENFPLFTDRFPRQLLSYLRLARLQDSAQFPKITFKADTIVSESNEYEVLMLLLNEFKERLSAYPQTLEDDQRLISMPARQSGPNFLQSFGGAKAGDEEEKGKALLAKKERLAAQLRASEKRILGNTITALRNRLAPIRGLPTKSGMGDPNIEIKEVFGMMEAGLSAPGRILSGLFDKDR